MPQLVLGASVRNPIRRASYQPEPTVDLHNFSQALAMAGVHMTDPDWGGILAGDGQRLNKGGSMQASSVQLRQPA